MNTQNEREREEAQIEMGEAELDGNTVDIFLKFMVLSSWKISKAVYLYLS